MYHDKCFQVDHQFTLIAFNHEQIRKVTKNAYVITNRANFPKVVNRIQNIDVEVLYNLINKLHSGQHVISSTVDE